MKQATGAHAGTGTWLLQRATALVLAVLLPLLLVRLLGALPVDFAGWQAIFSLLWVRAALMLVACALALHAWVGMRDLLMDYVHATAMRLTLELAVVVILAGSVAWLMVLLQGGA